MLRNREIRRFAVCFFAIAGLAAVLGFRIDTRAGWLCVGASSAFGALFLAVTKARYNRLARLSEQIDLVLHNTDCLYIQEEEEGELSILQSEIVKMTLRIREQNEALKREKEHLADALADIAHQIRTPLTSANLVLSLLEKNPDEKERRVLLHEAAELSAQMEWLVNSLLKLSRLDAGIAVFQKLPVAVDSLITAAARPFLIAMELHEITLRTEVPHGMTIQGDVNWLSEALQNILKNSMQSVGDGGWIAVTCRQTPLFDEIRIHDSGEGFAKDDLPHVFERFYRGRQENASGYGIGLAISRTVIIRHNGTITAKNHPQGGAVFTIRFLKEDL